MPTAVVANRIYFTPEDREPFKKALTYKIPARSQHEFPLVLKTYKLGQDGMISVPVGRLDLIPEGYEVKDMRVTKPVEFPEFKGTLRPSQQEIYDDVDDNCIINAKVSFGKAQPLYSKIKTPNGWTTMKDIAVGDTVTTPDGGEAAVINKFFHYDKPIFRVTTLDGRTVDACEDHLWSIYIKDSKKQKLKTTKELIELLNQGKVISLPLTSEIRPKKAEQNFIIHPYVLGILLGDGSISTRGIKISSADDFIIKKVNSLLPENHTLKYSSKYDYRLTSEYEKGKARKNLVLNELRRLNLLGTRSHTKFIPKEYKNLNLKNTLYLIQGLMDSDGWVDKIGTSCEFCSSSKQLMDDFCELIYSMGGCAAIQSKIPTYIYKGEKKDGKITYRARPNKLPFHIKKELFSLPRKKDKILPGKLDNSNKVKISKIEYLNNQDCCCIEIDSEASLYITDNYLVTHNTFTALAIAAKLGQKTLVITHTLALRDQWVAEIEKVFGFKPGIIGSGKFQIDTPIVVANVQTLSKKTHLVKKEFGTVVMDECLDYSSRIYTKEGEVAIGTIVNKKLTPEVLSYNEDTKTLEWKRVVRHFKNPETTMLQFSFNNATVLKCTKNHNVYSYNKGKIPAEQLEVGDFLIARLSHKTSHLLREEVKPLILGMILGDGHLRDNGASVRLSITHGEAQLDYLKYKASLLPDAFISNEVKGKSGFKATNSIYHKTTLSFYDMDEWKDALYSNSGNKKFVDIDIAASLTKESWSIIFMDDGAMNIRTITFSVCELTKESLSNLQLSLKNLFDIDSRVYYCKKGFAYITLGTKESLVFLEAIAHLIHPCLRYKFGEYTHLNDVPFVGINPAKAFEEYSVVQVTNIKDAIPTYGNRFNIEVEDNHNYFANGKLVSNCHHLSASTFTKVLDSMWARYKIGLSGTITRKDGKHVLFSDFLGFKIYQPPAENFMEPIVHIYNTGFDLPPSQNWADRVTMLETDAAYQHDVAKLAALYAAAGHYVLVVGNRVEFLQNVAELIGDDAVCITGSVRADRNELLQSIGKTKKILCGTISIFSEGISYDILSCLILATPVNNEPLLEQITGRIVRIQEGKPTPIVVDLHLKGGTGKNQANERSKFYFSKGWKVKVIT